MQEDLIQAINTMQRAMNGPAAAYRQYRHQLIEAAKRDLAAGSDEALTTPAKGPAYKVPTAPAERHAWVLQQARAHHKTFPGLAEGYTHNDVDKLLQWGDEADDFLFWLSREQATAPASDEVLAIINQWVIISKKEGRGLPYWRANSAGYADSITQAGLYSYEQAASITAGTHGDDEKYCIDDPALAQLISNQSYLRGKELALWLESTALLARVRQAEAHSATLQGALESSADTNRVLAQRLKTIADALPTIAKHLTDAVGEADAEFGGRGDGYEQCYNECDNAAAALRKLLRELNPTVKGGQQDA